MLPAIEAGRMGELGSTWYIADMKPGGAPFANLARSLIESGVFGDRWSNSPEGNALLTATLRRSDIALANLVRQAELPKYANLLVLADQFEELFRYEQDSQEAQAFVNSLLESSRASDVSIYIVMTMRSEFLGQCTVPQPSGSAE